MIAKVIAVIAHEDDDCVDPVSSSRSGVDKRAHLASMNEIDA